MSIRSWSDTPIMPTRQIMRLRLQAVSFPVWWTVYLSENSRSTMQISGEISRLKTRVIVGLNPHRRSSIWRISSPLPQIRQPLPLAEVCNTIFVTSHITQRLWDWSAPYLHSLPEMGTVLMFLASSKPYSLLRTDLLLLVKASLKRSHSAL